MMDSPWLTASASRSEFDTYCGSSIALHSIYGSQVSQLPMTVSKASLEEEEEEDDDEWSQISHEWTSSLSQTNVRRTLRPKTAPASKSRLQRPTSAVHSFTVSTTIRQRRQSTNNGRPITAALPSRRNSLNYNQQPSLLQHGGGNQRRLSRPNTAQPLRGGRNIVARPSTARPLSYTSSSMAGSGPLSPSVAVEEPELLRMKEKTVPVLLTNVPQYFNFWNEKPIRRREWGIPTHERRLRKCRPKSDYGIRGNSLNKTNLGNNTSGVNGAGGGENDLSELGTLFEVADGSVSSHEGGKKKGKEKRRGKGTAGSDSDDGESSKTNEDMVFNSELDQGLNGAINDSTLSTDDFKKRGIGVEGSDDDTSGDKRHTLEGENENENDLEYKKLEGGNEEYNNAENDDYFSQRKKGAGRGKSKSLNDLDSYAAGYSTAMSTRFELPMDLKLLETMTPMEYLSKHCVISQRRKFHYMKTFTKLKGKDIIPNITDTLTDKSLIVQGIINVHFELVTAEEVYHILQVADYSNDAPINFQLFGALCALTERHYCSQRPGFSRKELIEVVDFEALDWRLRNCVISDSLKTLFQLL